MGSIFAFIVIGFFAGLIARAIMPGPQSMGFILTTLLGMSGALIGGLIGSALSSEGRLFELRTPGILLSVVGSLVILAWVTYADRRGRVLP